MLDKALLATVNSDDPAYFEAYVNENLAAVTSAGSLTREDVAQLIRNSFEIAWIDPADRDGADIPHRCAARASLARLYERTPSRAGSGGCRKA